MTTEDEYTTVHPGNEFPNGAVRALSRGLQSEDVEACDSFVALWVRDGGETVFGRAFNKAGKAEAYFALDGKVVHSSETKGFRMLKYIGPHKNHTFKYKWIRSNKANPSEILLVGGYCPAVVKCPDGSECLGNGCPDQKKASTCNVTAKLEEVHEGENYENAFILCKVKQTD